MRIMGAEQIKIGLFRASKRPDFAPVFAVEI